MRKLEFIIIFQVLLGFKLIHDAGKEHRELSITLFKSIHMIVERHACELRREAKF